jgi:hypothetical protein
VACEPLSAGFQQSFQLADQVGDLAIVLEAVLVVAQVILKGLL